MSPILIAWGALGLLAWWALLRGGPGGRVFAAEWGRGETILAALLGGYFLLLAVPGAEPRKGITLEVVRASVLFYAAVLALLLAFLAGRGLSPLRAFGLAPPRPIRVLGLAVLCFAATYPAVLLIEQATAAIGHPVSAGDPMVQFLRGPVSAVDKGWAVLLAVVAAPVTEEFIFRGFFYGVLKRHAGRVVATGVSALLFAAIHQNLPALPALATLAVGFTLAYELAGSLWAPIAMHAIFNSISVAVILFFPEWTPNA